MQYAKDTNTLFRDSIGSRITLSSAFVTCLLLIVLATGCAAPFSDLQNARMVGKGKVEANTSYSSVYFDDDTDTEHAQNQIGFQAAYGISDRIELRLRYERVTVDKEGEDPVNVLGFGPKLGIVEDIAALNLPIGLGLRDGVDVSETLQFHPTLLLTLPGGRNFEVNTSAKALIPLTDEDSDVLIAFNLGTGISTNLEKWAVRPEFGFLFNPGEDGRFMHFSIGLAVYP